MNDKGLSLSEINYIVLMCILWGGFMFSNFLHAVVLHIPFFNVFSEYFITFFIIVCTLGSIQILWKRLSWTDIAFYLSICVIYYLNYEWHPNNRFLLEENEEIFLYNALLYYFVGVTCDYERLKKYFYYVSIFVIYVSYLWYFVLSNGQIDFNNDDKFSGGMSTSYAMLPHVIYISYCSFKDGRWYNYLSMVLGILFMLGMGNRGSLVAVVLFFAIYFLFYSNRGEGKAAFKILVVTLTAIAYLLIDFLVQVLSLVMIAMGGSMRIIDKFYTKELSDDSGRKDVRDKLIDSIDLFNGQGFFGDQNIADIYAHNLFLEWAVSFGLVETLIFSTLLFYISYKAYKNSSTIESKIFVVMLLCCCFKLMVTGTFTKDTMFFFMVGVFIGINRNKNEYSLSEE